MKKALRQSIKEQLDLLSRRELSQQSENIANVLRSLPEYKKATNIAYYLHMSHQKEIETDKMLKNAFQDNKRVFIPKMVDVKEENKLFSKQTKELDMLEMKSIDQINALQPQGKYQIREPDSGNSCFDYEHGLDMIILPGMGFTTNCERIGHGRGFYDSFIIKHDQFNDSKSQPRPFLIAIGATSQLVDSIPVESHDRQLDALIINKDLYRVM